MIAENAASEVAENCQTEKKSRPAPIVVIDVRDESKKEWAKELISGIKTLKVNVRLAGLLGDGNYEGADFVILISGNDADYRAALSGGVVPICLARDLVEDYDPINETGNAMIAENDTVWGFFAALIRGLETYKFPYDWRHLVDSCRNSQI